MQVSAPNILGNPSTWTDALTIAQKYLPHDGITYEHRYNAHMERKLLAVLLVAAHRAGQLNFGYIYEMTKKLDADPEKWAKQICSPEFPEANEALDQILKSMGSMFCEPVKQLLLSLERSHESSGRDSAYKNRRMDFFC